MKPKLTTAIALGGCYAALATPALAYIDGATGSIILQSIIGAVATLLMFGRLIIAKVKTFFARFTKPSRPDAE